MKKVAITGGPAGGKSTAIRYLEKEYGNTMTFVPEAATLLLEDGFPAPSPENPWSAEWQRGLQESIAKTQISQEQISQKLASQQNKQLLVCDRGLADGAAYLPGGIQELSEMVNQEPLEILGRYDLVIHLTTSAKQSIGYQKQTNPHRFEDADQAIALDDRTLEAWQSHHNLHCVNIVNPIGRNRRVAAIILASVAL